jgi:hypothetical protein
VRRPSSAWSAWLDRTEPSLWWDRAEPEHWYDISDAADIADPIDPTDANEPMLANEPKDAALPMDRTESWEPIESSEFSDHRDHTPSSVAAAQGGGTNALAGSHPRWDARDMEPDTIGPPFDQFLATAEAVARERPDVDLGMAREVFREVATMLHNGLALDGLDDHDASAVVAGLCVDLVAPDPGAAVRARSEAVLQEPADLHDHESVSRSYLVAASILKL